MTIRTYTRDIVGDAYGDRLSPGSLALNSVMEFGTVIRIDGNTLTTDLSVYAPEVTQECDASGSHTGEPKIEGEGWEFLTGFSGQYGYGGPHMHQSEYIGGGLARYILDTPGEYAAVMPYLWSDDVAAEDAEELLEADTWLILFRPLDNG